MRIILVLAILSLPVTAGPVGDYLGFRLGSHASNVRSSYDSIHFYLPSPADSVYRSLYSDTTDVVAETLNMGLPAWHLRRVALVGGAPTVSVDTAVEHGDSLMVSPFNLFGVPRTANLYRVPFDSGSSWQLGVAGEYPFNIGDTFTGTIKIWNDSTTALGMEDVTVPWGTVNDCWHLLRRARQSLDGTLLGVPVRETSDVYYHEWYKDSLGWMKDSVVATARAYTWVIIWLPVADFFHRHSGELTEYCTAIAGPSRDERLAGRVSASPNPSRENVRILLQEDVLRDRSTVVVYDATGRKVRCLPAGPVVQWDGRDEDGNPVPSGSYVAVAGHRFCTILRLQ